MTCITQRPASLNKNATTQAEILIAHRILGPQDRDAIEDWIKHHRQEAHKKEVLASLAELKTGEAWLWAPDFPEDEPLGLRRVTMLLPETFDSRRTPKPGERRHEPSGIAPVDLEKLRTKMAATIERAKQADPRELRREVSGLRQQLSDLRLVNDRVKEKLAAKETGGETAILSAASRTSLTRLEKAIDRLDAIRDRMAQAQQVVTTEVNLLAIAIKTATPTELTIHPSRPFGTLPIPQPTRPIRMGQELPRAQSRKTGGDGGEDLTGPEQRIVNAIAWIESLGQSDAEQAAVAFLAGYVVGGGAFNNPKGKLHTKGFVEYRSGGRIALTESGRSRAQVPDATLTTQELHDRVLAALPGPHAKILRVLLECYPRPMKNSELAQRSGYADGGGAFNNPRGRLRSLGLIDYPDKEMSVAKPLLFLQ